MPLRTSRLGKAAVVAHAAGPGPAPVAKMAVVGAAVGPGRAPVAKTAVVAAAITPGRRRFSSSTLWGWSSRLRRPAFLSLASGLGFRDPAPWPAGEALAQQGRQIRD
jgi:hypothetical protein